MGDIRVFMRMRSYRSIHFRRVLCVWVLLVFFGNSLSSASPAPVLIKKGPSTLEKLTADPEIRQFASVEGSFDAAQDKSFRGAADRTVIFIQDAHTSLEAQENISKLIGSLVDRFGVSQVFEEGYEGPVPSDDYFKVPDPDLRERVSYFFLDHLLLGGAEYAHINRKRDFTLTGADDLQGYLENLKEYAHAARLAPGTAQDLEKMEEKLSALESILFPKDLQSWWKIKKRYEAKTLGMADYLSRTFAIYTTVWKLEELVPRYPSLTALARFSRSGELSASERRELEEAIRAVDPLRLFKEIGSIEKEFAGSLLSDPDAQELFFYLETLGSLKRLNRLEAVPEELASLEEALKRFSTKEVLEFLARISKRPFVLSSRWEDSIQNSFRFYRGARLREKALERSLGGDWRSAVLVFGGFHKDGICGLLRQEGISYLLLSPKITRPDPLHEKRYEDLMEGKGISSPLSFARNPSLYVAALGTPEREMAVREGIRRAEVELAKRSNDGSARIEADQAVAQALAAHGASMGKAAEEIRGLLTQVPSPQVSQEIFDRLRKLLIHQAFNDYAEVRDQVAEYFIKKNDLEHLGQLAQIVHDPKPSPEFMAGRVLALAGIVREMERTFPEGETVSYTQGEISGFRSNLRGLLPKLQAWAKEYASDVSPTEQDFAFTRQFNAHGVLVSFADAKDFPTADDIFEVLERKFRTLSRQVDRFDQDKRYQDAARHLNQRLLEIKFSAHPDRQVRLLNLMAKATLLNPKESTPLLVYLITQFLRYGYTIPERTPGPMPDFMDMANKTREAGIVYFVRLLGQILFTAHSGQMRLGVNEDERVKTRRNDYGQGIYGVLRDEIHNYLGMHVLGLLERQLEYYRTLNPAILYSKDYAVDAYRSKTAVPLFERSYFPEKIVNELDPKEDALGSVFIKALHRRLGKGAKLTFYHLLRTLPNDVLQKIIDDVNLELGTQYQLATDMGGPAAYLWVYRELAGRYSVGGVGHLLDRFQEIVPKILFIRDFDEKYTALKKNINDGQEEAALRQIIEFRRILREEMFKPNPDYDREAILDRFVKDYGRDDQGNAEGGAYYHDTKLNVYQADYYLSQIANFFLTETFSRKYSKITRENYKDALSFVQILSALGYLSGDYTLDQVDHAGVLVSPVPESIRTDILHLMLRETNQTDATYDRLIAPTVKRITQLTPIQSDINQFLPADILKKYKTPDDKRLFLARDTLSRMRGINREHRHLKKMLEALQSFRKETGPPKMEPAPPVKRPFVVLGVNSTPGELEQAAQIGRYELGAKGLGLVRALQISIPVPPFAIFSNRLTASEIGLQLDEVLMGLDIAINGEKNMGLGSQFAEGERPYFLAVRASTYLTMPGQTLTVSNIGMNEKNLVNLKERFMKYGINEDDALWAAADSYRRFLESYGMAIYHIPKSDFDGVIEDYKYLRAIKQKEDLTGMQMMEVAHGYKGLIEDEHGRSAVPDDPHAQLSAVIRAVQDSFRRARPYLEARNIQGEWPGTSIIIQAMAYGNIKSHMGEGTESGAGIVYTRDPNTWLYGMKGDFKWTAQGSDLADHTTHPLRYEEIPHRDWRDTVKKWGLQLEESTGANVEMEITVQKILGESTPWLLQQRDAYLPDPFNVFTRKPKPERILIRENEARGSAGGAYRGIAVYNLEDVPSSKELKEIGGDGVVLITDYIDPADVPVLFNEGIKGIITKRGGYVSHTSDIARELGITAVVDAKMIEFVEIDYAEEKKEVCKIGDSIIYPGDHLSIDGRTGRVSRGFLPVIKAESLGQDPPENRTQGLSLGEESGWDPEAITRELAVFQNKIPVVLDARSWVRFSAAQKEEVLKAAGSGLARVLVYHAETASDQDLAPLRSFSNVRLLSGGIERLDAFLAGERKAVEIFVGPVSREGPEKILRFKQVASGQSGLLGLALLTAQYGDRYRVFEEKDGVFTLIDVSILKVFQDHLATQLLNRAA